MEQPCWRPLRTMALDLAGPLALPLQALVQVPLDAVQGEGLDTARLSPDPQALGGVMFEIVPQPFANALVVVSRRAASVDPHGAAVLNRLHIGQYLLGERLGRVLTLLIVWVDRDCLGAVGWVRHLDRLAVYDPNVPDLVMSMAGKVRLSASLRSRMISELPVPLNSCRPPSVAPRRSRPPGRATDRAGGRPRHPDDGDAGAPGRAR